MPLQPPKRTAAGFFLALSPAIESPELRWSAEGTWVTDLSAGDSATTWMSWSDGQRASLLGELLSHGAWFSRPPRRDMLDMLFSPWVTRTMSGTFQLSCKKPVLPTGVGAEDGVPGRATWKLEGLLLSGTAVDPVWSVASATPDEHLDRISLFGGDSEAGDGLSVGSGMREIQIEEIEDAPVTGAPAAQIRSREWEARKFLAKERVREARLKAQIARHLAAKEEERFYRQYGDPEDGESHFSDYDLSDTASEGSDSESDGSVSGL